MSVLKSIFKKVQKQFHGATPLDVLKFCKLKEEKPESEKELLVFVVFEVKNQVEVLRMINMGFYRKEGDEWINDRNGKEDTFTHWLFASDLVRISK